MKRRLALIAGLSLASCGHAPVHQIARPTTTTTGPPIPEAADPTELDWAALEQLPRARASRSRPRVRLDPVPTTSPAAISDDDGVLACIRRIESGGRYDAVSASGKYRGAYQFDASTWRANGGTGDPAAASPAEQDRVAARLLARRGLQPWPTPSRRCG